MIMTSLKSSLITPSDGACAHTELDLPWPNWKHWQG